MFSLFSALHFDKIRSLCKTAVQTVLSAGGRPSLSTPTLVARARGVETSGEPLTAASLSVHAKRSSRLLFFCEIAESSRKLPFQSKKKWFFVVNTFVLIVPIEWQDKTWRADSDFEGKNYLCWLDLTVKLVKHEKCHIRGFKKLMKSICVLGRTHQRNSSCVNY